MTADKVTERMTAKTEITEIKFPRYTFKSLKAHKIDPSKYIMGEKGFIKKGAGTLLIGSSGMGKSVMSMQLAMSLATGSDLLGVLKVHKPRKVLLLQAENDEDILKRDAESIVKNLKLDSDLVERNLIIEHVYGTSDMSFVDYMERVIKDVRPEVVIVDPYQSYTTGNLNSTESFDVWSTVVDLIIKKYDIAMVLVTHTGKPRDTEGWVEDEMQYLSTGTAKQQNWARSAMILRYNRKDSSRFIMGFCKNPGAMGLKDDEGHLVKSIFVEHSHNSDEPFWLVSPDQSTAIHGTQKRVIEEMLIKYPDMDNKNIAAKIRMEHSGLDVSRQAIHNVRKKLSRIKKIKAKK